jgi:hypothetical protein
MKYLLNRKMFRTKHVDKNEADTSRPIYVFLFLELRFSRYLYRKEWAHHNCYAMHTSIFTTLSCPLNITAVPAYAPEVANSINFCVLEWWYRNVWWLKRSNAGFLKYAKGEALRRRCWHLFQKQKYCGEEGLLNFWLCRRFWEFRFV